MKMQNIVTKVVLNNIQRNSVTTILVGVMLLAFSSTGVASAIQLQEKQQSQLERQIALNQKKDANYQRVSLEVENEMLISALDKLANKVRVGFSFQEYVIPDKRITVSLTNVSVYEALDVLLKGTNLEATLAPDRDILIIRKKLSQGLRTKLETVTGTVTDAQSGEALPGVNVMVKGTNVGTSTKMKVILSLTHLRCKTL